MSSSSQKSAGSTRDEAKARFRAKAAAEKALPPREQLMNMLHAVRTTADSEALLNAFAADVLRGAARDLTNLPIWYTADLHSDWETGVQEAAKRVEEMAERLTGGAR
jgi:hypothetical protein